MAESLGHAAVPIGSVNTNTRFVERKDIESTSVWYEGGYFENIDQLRVRLEPDYKPQLAEIRRKLEECARVDRACWMVIP